MTHCHSKRNCLFFSHKVVRVVVLHTSSLNTSHNNNRCSNLSCDVRYHYIIHAPNYRVHTRNANALYSRRIRRKRTVPIKTARTDILYGRRYDVFKVYKKKSLSSDREVLLSARVLVAHDS